MSAANGKPGQSGDVILGKGNYLYRVEENWHKLPEGWSLVEVADIGVDDQDNVYIFNRGEHPVIVFDREGNFLRSWGEGMFKVAHALLLGQDNTLYLTDEGKHAVYKFTRDGKLLMTLGTPGEPAPFMSGRPFNRCTQVAVAPGGELFVSDGYGNGCVHKFSPTGKYVKSWGRTGSGPGEFNVVHYICCDKDGWLYVADRENHRIQVFDQDGRYETQWNNLHRPAGIHLFPTAGSTVFYVGELGPAIRTNREYPNIGPRISILDRHGNLLGRLGAERPGLAPDQFIAPHGLATDSRGDLYVGEVSRMQWNYWPDVPVPDGVRCLRKLVRVSSR